MVLLQLQRRLHCNPWIYVRLILLENKKSNTVFPTPYKDTEIFIFSCIAREREKRDKKQIASHHEQNVVWFFITVCFVVGGLQSARLTFPLGKGKFYPSFWQLYGFSLPKKSSLIIICHKNKVITQRERCSYVTQIKLRSMNHVK